jgi:hypothetical protein
MKKFIQTVIAIAAICLLPILLGHLLRETSGVTTSQDQATAAHTQEFLDNLSQIASH